MAIKTPSEYRNMEFVNLMREMSRLYKPYRYVEIGVKHGYTFNRISSDPWIGEAVAVDINEKMMESIPDTFPGNESRVVKKFIMSSVEFADEWRNQMGDEPSIDFLFIDGDHKYESVLADFENLSKFVMPFTGLIFLHDTYPIMPELAVDGYCSDAWKAAWYISRYSRSKYNCEIVTVPGPWAGLSIIRMLKGMEHMHWQSDGVPTNDIISAAYEENP